MPHQHMQVYQGLMYAFIGSTSQIMSTVCLRVQVSTWPGPSSTGQSPLYQDVACRGQLDVRRYQLTTYNECFFVCAAAA